ncbi:YgfZ/GcvT domain-containing protein [Aestuariivirga sp.]|uniref:YgfZ/GcvT domain-containing protein n=1 Tax=Aestuariivirga sp. TaxID=2650926 RepID=UPI0039E2BD6B
MMADATEMVFQRFTPGLLPGRAVVRVGGTEARHFLHNLLTADIEQLKESQATYAALLSPQGKILFDMFVYDAGGEFLIDCARSQRDDLIKRLTFYKLRAAATIAAVDDLAVGVSPEEPKAPLHYVDPRYDVMGWRFFSSPEGVSEAEGYELRAHSLRPCRQRRRPRIRPVLST